MTEQEVGESLRGATSRLVLPMMVIQFRCFGQLLCRSGRRRGRWWAMRAGAAGSRPSRQELSLPLAEL